MTKVRIDTDYSTQRYARETGLDKLSQAKLKPLADETGVVSQKQLERVAQGAGLDKDGVLTKAERQRIDGYLKDRQPIIVGASGGTALSARTAVKPAEGYIEVEHKLRGSDVVVDFDIGLYQGSGGGARDEHYREIVLQGFSPNGDNAIDFHRYGKEGADASVGYATGGSGAGYLMGIADAKKGAVLVNLSAAGAVAKQAPEVRTLLSPADLRDDPRIKALARKEGLDPKKLKVDVTSVSFHSDFQKVGGGGHPTMHTLLLSVELREEGSRKKPRETDLTVLITGNPAKSLAKLELGDVEVGVQNSWGYVFPPSVKFDDDDKKPAGGADRNDRGTGVRTGGGGESPAPAPTRRRGGGGEGSPVVRGGGGE